MIGCIGQVQQNRTLWLVKKISKLNTTNIVDIFMWTYSYCSIMTVSDDVTELSRWLHWNARIRSCWDRRRTATGRRTISRRIQSVCDSRDVSQASETGCSSRFSRCHKRHEGDLVGSMKEAVARWSWPLLVLETGGPSMTIFITSKYDVTRKTISNTWYSRDKYFSVLSSFLVTERYWQFWHLSYNFTGTVGNVLKFYNLV